MDLLLTAYEIFIYAAEHARRQGPQDLILLLGVRLDSGSELDSLILSLPSHLVARHPVSARSLPKPSVLLRVAGRRLFRTRSAHVRIRPNSAGGSSELNLVFFCLQLHLLNPKFEDVDLVSQFDVGLRQMLFLIK